MNILLITYEFPPIIGGISKYVYEISRRISGDILVLARENESLKDFDSNQNIPIYRFKPMVRFSFWSLLWRIFYLTFRERRQILFYGHFMSSFHFLGGLLLQKIIGIPYIILIHGNDFLFYSNESAFLRKLSFIALTNANLLITNSFFTKGLLLSAGCEEKQISVVHPGVDPSLFHFQICYEEIENRFNIKGKKVLLTVSRLAERKGHIVVIRALKEVIKEFPDVVYLIVGNGSFEKRLREEVNKQGLESYVIFAGYIPTEDLPKFYGSCDIFVMPCFESNNGKDVEGFGIVFAEAGASGKPVIAARSGGVEDIIVHNVTGILLEDPFDEKELARIILYLLKNPEISSELGKNARKRIEEYFSWDKSIEKIDKELINLHS